MIIKLSDSFKKECDSLPLHLWPEKALEHLSYFLAIKLGNTNTKKFIKTINKRDSTINIRVKIFNYLKENGTWTLPEIEEKLKQDNLINDKQWNSAYIRAITTLLSADIEKMIEINDDDDSEKSGNQENTKPSKNTEEHNTSNEISDIKNIDKNPDKISNTKKSKESKNPEIEMVPKSELDKQIQECEKLKKQLKISVLKHERRECVDELQSIQEDIEDLRTTIRRIDSTLKDLGEEELKDD